MLAPGGEVYVSGQPLRSVGGDYSLDVAAGVGMPGTDVVHARGSIILLVVALLGMEEAAL